MKVLVELILGHRATIRDRPTAEGFTHDWEVFVRGDSGNIQAFVDRVIFHLHESFPKHRRVVKEPPYCVKESGYAGFILHIEILFKNKEEPKKADFQYDLFLQSTGPPINPSRKEKLIFNYPSEEFAKKLFKEGGVTLDKPGHGVDKTYQAIAGSSSSTHHSGGGKSTKVTNASKTSPKNSFENLFGTPIKRSSSNVNSTTATSSSVQGGTVSGKNGSQTKEKSDKPPKDKTDKPEKISKSSKSSKSPSTLDTVSAASSSKSSSSKSSKSSATEKGSSKKMLPPANTSVPKKAKKSSKEEIIEHKPSKASKSHKKERDSSGKHDKSVHGKGKSSSGGSDRDRPSSRSDKLPLSPISSSSSSSSCSESSVASAISSEEESDSESVPTPPPPPIPKKSPSRKRSKKSQSRSPASMSVSSPPSSESSTSSVPASSTTKKRKGGSSGNETPPMSKKVVLEKAAPVSSTKDYRETKKSKGKSSEASKSKQVVSCEDISSAISPNTSSPGPSPKASKVKVERHEYVETSSPPPSSTKKSKSSKSSTQHHNNVNSTSSSHSSKVGKISKSVLQGMRQRGHDRERKERESRETTHDRGRRRDSHDYSSRSRSRSRSESVSSSTSSSDVSSDGTTSSTNAMHSSDMGNNNSSPGSSGGGGGNSNGGGCSGFSHAGIAGSITENMKLLRSLHAKISSLDDPEKLQEVVDIVEACGKDAWTVENGVTFDFDLCKLNAKTIGKLKTAIF